MSFQEVIVIGAPRSGTNMLRDVLCQIPGFGTWPCDEINYIWRHGNSRWPSDQFPAELATDAVKRYLNLQFTRRARIDALRYVVEKTCANSLRVPFVDRVLPGARYLFIHRDAVDAVTSAMRRWQASFDLAYTLKKARFVPWTDIPYYGWRFVRNRLHRMLSRDRRLASWGPRLADMERLARRHCLAEICALQWNACVGLAVQAFAAVPAERVHVTRYEDFVKAPAAGLRLICDFLGVEPEPPTLESAVKNVFDRSVGKGAHELDTSTRERIAALTASARSALARR